jgi:hypothetical protein
MSLILSGTDGISDIDGSAATPAIRGTDTNTGIFFPAADTIAFAEGGVESARFDPAGNFGLGVTPSAWATQVKAAEVNTTGGLASFSSGTGSQQTWLLNNAFFDSGFAWRYKFTGTAAMRYAQDAGQHQWYTAPSGTAGNAISFTQAMTLDASGNLLVGTTSAGGRLTVRAATGGLNVAVVENTTNASGDLALTLGLGTNANNTSSYFLVCQTPAVANRLFIYGNGNVVNTNNSYGSMSDAKLKENVTDATPKLDSLMQVRVVNYNLIGETQKQIGVVAQEIEQIFPGIVDEAPDIDAEGNDLGTTTKSVKYSVFVPMLIKAIQEQQAIIESLTARVEALDARLISLEGAQQ